MFSFLQELARPLKWDNIEEPIPSLLETSGTNDCNKTVQPDLSNLGRPTVLMLAGRDLCSSAQVIPTDQCRTNPGIPVKTEDKKLMGALALMQLSKAQTQEKEGSETEPDVSKGPTLQYLQL